MNDYALGVPQALGTSSSPTFAGLTVTGAATFAATVTATGRITGGDLLLSDCGLGSGATGNTGTPWRSLNSAYAGNASEAFFASAYLFTVNGNFPATSCLTALAAASLRVGMPPSATPIAQTFTIGEASRPGTDVNVAGSNGTIRSGLGTGTGTPSVLLLQTPTVAASGSGAQAYTSCVVAFGGLTSSFPALERNGNGIRLLLADGSDFGTFTCGTLIVPGSIVHAGASLGFFGTSPITKPTGVTVDAAGIHAALVSLGLIGA